MGKNDKHVKFRECWPLLTISRQLSVQFAVKACESVILSGSYKSEYWPFTVWSTLWGFWKNCLNQNSNSKSSCVICIFRQMSCSLSNDRRWSVRERHSHWRNKKYIQKFDREVWRWQTTWETRRRWENNIKMDRDIMWVVLFTLTHTHIRIDYSKHQLSAQFF